MKTPLTQLELLQSLQILFDHLVHEPQFSSAQHTWQTNKNTRTKKSVSSKRSSVTLVAYPDEIAKMETSQAFTTPVHRIKSSWKMNVLCDEHKNRKTNYRN